MRVDQCLKNRTPYGTQTPLILLKNYAQSSADIQTLARMTGKDFSGPVPVIKAPTPLKMVEDDPPPQRRKEETPTLKKKNHTPGKRPASQEEEVLGDVDDYQNGD